MRKVKKILIWGGAVAAVLVSLLAGALLLLPDLLDMDAIGRNALATLEARYHIHSDQIRISFFPYPRAIVYGTRVTLPEVLTASADSVVVYPKLVPLLTGKFRPAEINLLGPKLSVKLPNQAGGEPPPETSADKEKPGVRPSEGGEPAASQEKSDKHVAARFTRLKDRIDQLQAALSAALPGIVFDVDNGSLELYTEKGRAFWFQDIEARATLLTNRIDFDLSTGKSGLWNALTFNGWIDPRTGKVGGELNFTGGSPQDLIAYFFPSATYRVSDSLIDGTLILAGNGNRDARADFNATVSQITVQDGEEKTSLANGSVTGSLLLDPQQLDITLSRFRFDDPRLSVTGRYVNNFASQTVTLDLESRDTDAAAVRRCALALDGKNQVSRRIFEIVRDGEVPFISFNARANNTSDLKKMENYTITGTLEHGTVFAPKAELLVSGVHGDVYIEDGILDARNLAGRSGGTSTDGGVLRVGLRKEDPTFHLDLPLDADLADLPEVLLRVVKDEPLRRELKETSAVKGRTRGRLLLGESLDAVEVKVETGPFQLSGRYSRIPDYIDVDGASFVLENSKITIQGLAGKAGNKTKLTHVDFGYDWKAGRVLEIKSSDIFVLALLHVDPLIRMREDWRQSLNGGGAPIGGAVHLDSLHFKGPLDDSSKWVFSAEGAMEGVSAKTRYFAGPVTLKSGRFELNRETFTLKQINASFSDSNLIISGTLNGYFEKLRTADLTASGRLGPVGNKDIATLAELPGTLRAINDLTLDRSHFSWERGAKTAFDGEMLLSAGPKININLVKTPDEVSIEDLVVKDADSDASISLKWREKRFKVRFSGSLSNRTADRLLTENKLLTGPIQGKFKAQLYLDAPRRSSAEGQLRISGFQLPLGAKTPARIESAVLEAADNRINVKSAMISWNGTRFSLGGAVTIAEDVYLVDMNAFADTLDLEKLIDSGKKEQPEDGGQTTETVVDKAAVGQPRKGWDAPVTGTVRVRSERLTYGQFTWNPANADVVISPGTYEIKVTQANLCGISTPGWVNFGGNGTKLALSPEARDQDIEPAVACLLNKKQVITGKFTLNSNLSSEMKGGSFVSTLGGDIDLKIRNGRIYNITSFVKIMSLLGITEIYRGQLPDLFTEGCAFDTVSVKGKISHGKLVLTESKLDGSCVRMVFRGEVDFARKKVDVVALVAPLRTVDKVIGMVPLVNKVFNGSIISIPVRISGDLGDPSVIPMSPTAVGEELFGFMKRTFKLPFTLLQPLSDAAGRHGGHKDSAAEGANGTEMRTEVPSN
ncbi:MAG: AsmA-like C-terminal domain-containing protein [Syntrophobacter sp.]